MDDLVIEEVTTEYLSEYSKIPISFVVKSILKIDPIDDGFAGFTFAEIPVPPWEKGYDEYNREGMVDWALHFDISNWMICRATIGGKLIGGTAIAYDTPGVFKLEGRKDIAVLWDIRIHPDFRNQGNGTKLFDYAVNLAKGKNCKFLKIETQNINVPACKFYRRNGCVLGAFNQFAYSDFPEECELIWYKSLMRNDTVNP